MKRGRLTQVERQTAAQGLPTAPALLPQSPPCERCVCCRSSGSCHGKCIQKQPKQTGLVNISAAGLWATRLEENRIFLARVGKNREPVMQPATLCLVGKGLMEQKKSG